MEQQEHHHHCYYRQHQFELLLQKDEAWYHSETETWAVLYVLLTTWDPLQTQMIVDDVLQQQQQQRLPLYYTKHTSCARKRG